MLFDSSLVLYVMLVSLWISFLAIKAFLTDGASVYHAFFLVALCALLFFLTFTARLCGIQNFLVAVLQFGGLKIYKQQLAVLEFALLT